jgi:hypothetical protein
MTTRPISLASGLAALSILVACQQATPDAPERSRFEIVGVPSPAGPGSTEPNLALAADGGILLSWVEPAGDSTHALRFSQWQDSAWSSPRTIVRRSDFWLNWADFPTMASLGGDLLAAHWPQRSGEGRYDYDVRISLSQDGGASWSDGIVPHPSSRLGEHGFVAMAWVNDSLLAIWLDGRGYDTTNAGATRAMALVSRTVSPNGGLGDERTVDARACDCCQTDMAITARGPVVVYRDRSDDEIRDLVLSRREPSGWTAPHAIYDDGWHVNYCPVNGPAVAARDSRVVAAWFTAPNDSPLVRVAFSDDDGDTFAAPVRVDDGDPVGRVDVALLPDGSAAVTWLERVGAEGAEVRVRRVLPDGTRGEAAVIGGSSAARASGFPRMGVAGDAIVFAWTQPGDAPRVQTALARLP